MKVLVIDDDPDLLNLVRAQLSASGHEVLVAESGAHGLARAREDRPEVVICDLRLPDLDGIEAAATLRAHRATWSTPVVLISADDSRHDRVRALQRGVDDVVRKPFSPAELESRLETLVRRSRQSPVAHPLTGLPRRPWIMQHVNHRLQKGDGIALAYCDLEHFEAFRAHYGPQRSDAAARAVARLLGETADAFGAASDMVGHLADRTFAYVGAPERLEAVVQALVARFDEIVGGFYDEAERRRGGIEVTDPLGVPSLVPMMSLSVGACINERRALRTALQMGEVCAEMRHAAAASGASAYRIDRRREHRPLLSPRAATA